MCEGADSGMGDNRVMKQQVYDFLKQIPQGKVITYGQLAEQLGNKNLSRAVGNTLHRNPDPAHIPCHRVVNRNGQVSEAYAFGGADAQRVRLEREGIIFEPDGTIDLRKYGIAPEEMPCAVP